MTSNTPAVPARLYHATWPSRIDAILHEGIHGNDTGEVYLAGKPEHAAGFLRLRTGEYLGYRTVTIDVDGQPTPVHLPNIIQHDTIHIVEIDTSQLDPNRIAPSTDHAAFYTPADLTAWVHTGNIAADAITGHTIQPTRTR